MANTASYNSHQINATFLRLDCSGKDSTPLLSVWTLLYREVSIIYSGLVSIIKELDMTSCTGTPDLLSLLKHPEEGGHGANVKCVCGDGHDVVKDASHLPIQNCEHNTQPFKSVMTKTQNVTHILLVPAALLFKWASLDHY